MPCACRYGHQLPDLLLKLSVAGTYVIEIPAPFLVLVPFRPVRLLAAALQVFLQVRRSCSCTPCCAAPVLSCTCAEPAGASGQGRLQAT